MGTYTPHGQSLCLIGEMALAKQHSREHEWWNEHTHRLPPLQVGDHDCVHTKLSWKPPKEMGGY